MSSIFAESLPTFRLKIDSKSGHELHKHEDVEFFRLILKCF